MKHIFISLLLILQGCSSSSTENKVTQLIGTWLSNCHEFTVVNTTGFAVTLIDITNETYTINETLYDSISCANPTGNVSTTVKSYTIGEPVITTDGVSAQRLTLSITVDFFQNPTTITTEHIFRVTGVELNLGDFLDNITPSLDFTTTYVKQ